MRIVLLSPLGSGSNLGRELCSFLALKYFNLTKFFEEKAQKDAQNLSFEKFPLDVALYEIRNRIALLSTGYVFDVCIDKCPEALKMLNCILPKTRVWIRLCAKDIADDESLICVTENYLTLQSTDDRAKSPVDLSDVLSTLPAANLIIKENMIASIPELTEEIISTLQQLEA